MPTAPPATTVTEEVTPDFIVIIHTPSLPGCFKTEQIQVSCIVVQMEANAGYDEVLLVHSYTHVIRRHG